MVAQTGQSSELGSIQAESCANAAFILSSAPTRLSSTTSASESLCSIEMTSSPADCNSASNKEIDEENWAMTAKLFLTLLPASFQLSSADRALESLAASLKRSDLVRITYACLSSIFFSRL
ncbi:hypothetical protein D3C87_1692780 [compost metagenome]